MEEATLTPRKRLFAIMLAAAATAAAALMMVGMFAAPAQADSSNWNHDCRGTWINNASPSGEAWSSCRSSVTGGEVKLHVDKVAAVDYSGSWKAATHKSKIDRTVCLWGCRSASVSRQGV